VKRGKKEGEHENQERWLLTYADLITLLLGLFVILYAMSKIDAGRYAELVQALGGVFGGAQQGTMAGNHGIIEPPIQIVGERQRIEQEIKHQMKENLSKGLMSVEQNERGITVHMMEELLFPSGSAELKQSSLAALDTLASILTTLRNDVRVEGHTDNVPIHTQLYPSNWHLSVSRAMNTAYYLMGDKRLDPERLSVTGYSEYRPLSPNTSDENRSRNRRVDIVIVTDVPHDESKSSTSTTAKD
jgi:chemotaxis protein MotB